MPKELNVYTAQSRPVEIDTLSNQLAKSLNMERHSIVENHWINTQEDSALFLEDRNRYIVYSRLVNSEYVSEQKETIDTAEEKVKTFFQTHQLLENFEITKKIPIVFEDEGFHEALSNEEVDGYQYTITANIEGIPFYPHSVVSALAEAWTDLSGKIVKIRFTPIKMDFEKVEQYKPLSFSSIQNNMKNGEITYIKVHKTIAGETSIDEVEKINFTNAQLEYRQNENNGYVLPYIRFNGIGTDDNNEQYYIEAISPAIQVE